MHREPDSNPSLFIVESLRFSDEKDERFEGRVLEHVLKLADKEVEYFYIRTRKELETVLDKFDESRMRYLHISCHGNPYQVALTLDTLSTERFAEIVNPHVKDRRIFFSACGVVNNNLARLIIPESGCHSLIGPETDIEFGDAVLMWSSFYHLMFKENPEVMKGKHIRSTLKRICDTFDVPFLYCRSSRSAPEGFKSFHFPQESDEA